MSAFVGVSTVRMKKSVESYAPVSQDASTQLGVGVHRMILSPGWICAATLWK
jgi:hypothetical protein